MSPSRLAGAKPPIRKDYAALTASKRNGIDSITTSSKTRPRENDYFEAAFQNSESRFRADSSPDHANQRSADKTQPCNRETAPLEPSCRREAAWRQQSKRPSTPNRAKHVGGLRAVPRRR